MNEMVKELGQTLTEKDFSALMNALNQTALVSVTDVKGNILYANTKFVEVSKYALNELLGHNHRILKSGHQPDELFVTLWKTIAQGKVWRGEIKNRAKDGSYYWADTSIAPIFGPDGKPERYISVRFLLTARNEKEETFTTSFEVLDQTALISITDIKGDILYANNKFLEVSKYTLKELTGQNHRILQSGDYSDELYTGLWDTITQGKVWRGEIKNRAKDGSYYWVDTSIAPIINERGKPERHIGIGFLISDRKELEEDRNTQIQNLEKMNKFMIGRELKMVELKEKIKALEKHV